MKRLFCFIQAAALLVTVLFASPLFAVDMQEGEWEYVSELVMEGMPFSIPPAKIRKCLTRKDLVPASEDGKNCTIKDQQISGNTVKWTQICKDKDGTSEGKGTITYSGSSYKGSIKMAHTDKSGSTEHMTVKLSGKYLGQCSKETLAADKAQEKRIRDSEKAGLQAQKHTNEIIEQQQQTQKEERRKAEAIIAKVHVPKEDPKPCVFDTVMTDKNKECESAMGELNLKEGIWKIEKETASRTVDYNGQEIFSAGSADSAEKHLSSQSPLAVPVGGCGGNEKTVVKRSGNKLIWNFKCDYSQGDMKNTNEVKGGIVFNGNNFDGGIVETSYAKINGMGTTTTKYTKVSGTFLEGRAFTSQKRSYTSSDREETPADKIKDATDNPLKSIKKIFKW